jgi:hypothetical protein
LFLLSWHSSNFFFGLLKWCWWLTYSAKFLKWWNIWNVLCSAFLSCCHFPGKSKKGCYGVIDGCATLLLTNHMQKKVLAQLFRGKIFSWEMWFGSFLNTSNRTCPYLAFNNRPSFIYKITYCCIQFWAWLICVALSGNCDNCMVSKRERDMSKESFLLMSCIQSCEGNWGLNMPVDVLRGSRVSIIYCE